MSAPTPLWRPDASRVADCNLARFTQLIARDVPLDCTDHTALHRWSIEQPEAFWRAVWSFSEVRGEPGSRTLLDAGRMPGARWFPDGRLNFAENLLRRCDDSDALVFWTEAGRQRRLSWRDLNSEVARVAAGLSAAGVRRGDRVAAYLRNAPETVVAMLAASSVGAIWSSCSPDFGVNEVVERFGQIEPKVIFVCGGYVFNGVRIDVAEKARAIVERLPSLTCAVLVREDGAASGASLPGAIDYEAFGVPGAVPVFERLPFDHPLFIVFSSGTTGKPKCIVHGAGGTLLQHLKEHRLHTDVRPGDRLFYFTTCGWMMWNWLVSGLASEATLVLYDGSAFAANGRILFDLAQAERVTQFGASAKFIDTVAKLGLQPGRTHRLDHLRTLLSTGSPLAAESFDFVYRDIKADLCLASISGGTDIISCFVLGSPALPVWRGEAQCLGLGMSVEVFDDDGRSIVGRKGELVCTRPFPSMPLGLWNDADGAKYRAAYFERYPGVWHHGDYVELTEHESARGMIIHGRSDAVLKPGGVRIGTAEIYRYVHQLDEIVESLVIGQQWHNDVRVVLFVKLREGRVLDEALVTRIKDHVRVHASPAHVPAKILQVTDIPRTRSGKIAELAVRDVVHGRQVKNAASLMNAEALQQYRDRAELSDPAPVGGGLLFEVVWRSRGLVSQQLETADLPSAREVRGDVEPIVAQLRDQAALVAQLESISLTHVANAFAQLAPAPGLGSAFTIEEWAATLGVAAAHRALFAGLVRGLASGGWLRPTGERFELVRPLSGASASGQALDRHPELAAELSLVERCGRGLAAVLAGRHDPLTLLFPEGEADSLRSLYRDAPTFGPLNSLVGATVARLARDLPAHRAVRILEIGAGTGGTTHHVLSQLNPGRAEYVFTDVGAFFLRQARHALGDHPDVEYRTLDIERPLGEEWSGERFDIVIAANALHATRDIHLTLRNVRSLLAPGGALVLLEATAVRRWIEITFGLTEGWWKFTDGVRSNGPLIAPERWREVLQANGFVDTDALTPAVDLLLPQSVIVARAPAGAARRDRRQYLIVADRAADASALSHDLRAGRDDVDVIDVAALPLRFGTQSTRSGRTEVLYLPEATQPGSEHSGAQLVASAARACHDVTAIVRAALAAGSKVKPRVRIVTRGAVAVDREQLGALAHAPLWGLAASIVEEHPDLDCAVVDVPMQATAADWRAIASECAADVSEDRVALRAGRRFVARFERSEPPSLADTGLAGTFLVTGGLGALGLVCARWLAEQGVRHLVLVGRHEPNEAARASVAAIRALGAEVVVHQGDVGRRDDVSNLLADIAARLPPLRGVIHAAGVTNDAPVLGQSEESYAHVFAAKIAGAWNLHQATRHLALDSFVMFSSAAAVLGSRGAANYAAGNAFLDALAHARRAAGLPALSINWGPWADVGGTATAQILTHFERRGIAAFAKSDGLAMLDRLLRQPKAQVSVIDVNWREYVQGRVSRFFSRLDISAGDAATARPPARAQLDALPATERFDYLSQHVRQLVADVVGIAAGQDVSTERGFFELGLDSLSSVELRNRLRRSLQVDLPATLAFDYPTVAALLGYLRAEVFESGYFGGDVQAPAALAAQPTLIEAEAALESVDDAIAQELAQLQSLLQRSS